MTEELLAIFVLLESSTRIRLYSAAMILSQWFRPPAELYRMANVSHRRAELELARLVAEGWLERHEKGSANYTRLVRFTQGPTPINLIGVQRSKRSGYSDQLDRGTAIETIGVQRSKRSGYSTSSHARGPAPPDLDLAKGSDPSVHPEGSGEAHARTGETFRATDLRGSDVQWVKAQWSVSGAVAHTCWTRLLSLKLTREEGRLYLIAAKRGTHDAFRGLWGPKGADKPLGAACTRERVEPWIEWHRRARVELPRVSIRDTRPSAEELAQRAELAKRAQRAAAGELDERTIEIPILEIGRSRQ